MVPLLAAARLGFDASLFSLVAMREALSCSITPKWLRPSRSSISRSIWRSCSTVVHAFTRGWNSAFTATQSTPPCAGSASVVSTMVHT